MSRLFITFIVFVIPFFESLAQKTAIGEGESLIRVENNVTRDETVKKATEMAMINAIENTFGRVLIQGNSTLIENLQTNEKVETSNYFNSISDSYVNGEWMETLSNKVEFRNGDDGYVWVMVKVKGKILERKKEYCNFNVYPLNCNDPKCESSQFTSGQNLFIYFKSAVNGFVAIYFDDPQMQETFRIFPYKNETKQPASKPVIADKEYILFSRAFNYWNAETEPDQLIIEAEKPLETYKIFVLFSSSSFDEKPLLDDKTSALLRPGDQKLGFTMPASLKSSDFQRWLLSFRTRVPGIQLTQFYITVKKP